MNENNFNLGEQFTRLQWLLHRSRLQNRMGHGPMGDPHRGQGRILSLLKMKPEISQRDLSYLLDMRPQSLGEILGKLEKNGYITRTPSEEDRRIMIIRLTEEGKNAAASDQEKDLNDIFNCLTEEEQATLSEYLNRIIKEMELEMGNDSSENEFERRREEFERFFSGEGGGNPFGGNPFHGGFRHGENPFGRRFCFGGRRFTENN